MGRAKDRIDRTAIWWGPSTRHRRAALVKSSVVTIKASSV
jgi:hypothetical protein